MRFRAYSMWGYEVSACQTCGVASHIDPCRDCRKTLADKDETAGVERLFAVESGDINSGGRDAQTSGHPVNPDHTGADMQQGATPVNNLAKRATR